MSVHWCDGLPEREDHGAEDQPQPLRKGIQGHRGQQEQQKVSFAKDIKERELKRERERERERKNMESMVACETE